MDLVSLMTVLANAALESMGIVAAVSSVGGGRMRIRAEDPVHAYAAAGITVAAIDEGEGMEIDIRFVSSKYNADVFEIYLQIESRED